MNIYRSTFGLPIIFSLLVSIVGSEALAQDLLAEAKNKDDKIAFSTSVIVVGNTNRVPLDQASINALFTSAFYSQVSDHLAKKYNIDKEVVTPSRLLFIYESNGNDGGQTATLGIEFRSPPEDLIEQLHVDAPQIVRELVVEYVDNFFSRSIAKQAREMVKRTDHLMLQRAKLGEHLNKVRKRQIEMASETIESASDLQNHYRRLKEQQREDRLRLLGAHARREAIERQIEKLNEEEKQDEKQRDEPPMDAESQLLRAVQEQQLAAMERELKQGSPEIELLKGQIEFHEKAVNRIGHLQKAGEASVAQLDEAKQALELVQHELIVAEREIARRAKQFEAIATKARIDLLQRQQKVRQERFGNQLESLNQMLTELAIESDEQEARRNAMKKELALLEENIRGRLQIEFEGQKIEREAERLELQLEQIEERLMYLELNAGSPEQEEFGIVPWGP